MQLPSLFLALSERDLPAAQPPGKRVRLASRLDTLMYRLATGNALPEPDPAKRWDAANVAMVAQDLPRSAPVLDCGAFMSSSTATLATLGFRHLHGIDIAAPVVAQPLARRALCTVQDMQATAYDDESFELIVSASTIEHGVSWERFLHEAKRLLRPGGLLYVSTDLVPDDADVSHVTAFGLPWTPLRPSQMRKLLALVRNVGFEPPPYQEIELLDPPLSFAGQAIGFAALAVRSA